MLHPNKARLVNGMGEEQTAFNAGEDIEISANYEVNVQADCLNCAITVYDSEQKEIFSSDRQGKQFVLKNDIGKHKLHIVLHQPQLLAGHYFITCEIWNPQSGFVRGVMNKKPFEIKSNSFMGTGIMYIDCSCTSV